MRSRKRTGLALAAIAIVAVGCGSSNSSTSAGGAYGAGGSSSTTAPASTGGSTAVIAVADNPKLGKILVDSKGVTVYYFEKDKQGGKSSTCSGACASVWPPVTTSGAPNGVSPTVKGQKGVQASKLGTIKRSDGSNQVTYNGWPLYTYVSDKKPGDAKGNDLKQFGATWYALTPAGVHPPEG
jgi:predicted lipoprotein with Yx(FWY)xxD motif